MESYSYYQLVLVSFSVFESLFCTLFQQQSYDLVIVPRRKTKDKCHRVVKYLTHKRNLGRELKLTEQKISSVWERTDRLGPEKLRQERQGVPRSEKTQLDDVVPGSAPAGQ